MSSDKFDDVRSLLDINEGDLNTEFVRLPGHTARWAFLAAEATNEVASAKHNYDKVFAATHEEIRTGALAKGDKLTVDQINNRTAVTLKVVLARDAVSEAEMRKAKTLAVCEGLRAKRDMLIQLGASQRAAKESDLWMKQNRTPPAAPRPGYDPGPQWPRFDPANTNGNPDTQR